MPALNFHPKFRRKILSGEKAMTIRKERRNPIKRGDELLIYVGQRTPKSKLIAKATCAGVTEIKITEKGIFLHGETERLNIYRAEALALEDGFNSAAAFINSVKKTHGLPFSGVVIYWE